MKRSSPPPWMESILQLILPSRDRDTIAGDLHEQYRVTKLAELGLKRADLWYAHQVLSFVPAHITATFERSPVLVLLCSFTAACGVWLGMMGLRLRHPGYREGELIAGTIVMQAALTLLALCFRTSRVLRWLSLYGAGVVTLLALQATDRYAAWRAYGRVRAADCSGTDCAGAPHLHRFVGERFAQQDEMMLPTRRPHLWTRVWPRVLNDSA